MCGVDRQRGAASGVGTRRESVRGGSVAASMPPHGPAPGRGTTLPRLLRLIGKQCLQGHVQAPAAERSIRIKTVAPVWPYSCRPGSTEINRVTSSSAAGRCMPPGATR
ncbi:hypothetical protein XarjCFBP7645_14830 [Xanthomonas arboricola]|uniref:Uncharacterized protein n=1 Tax=Xanthomonas arboricola TaxID=56448 RepID=A0A2S7AA41_9XANT|nr:hypothetical protein XarjCFBP7645_14830 [Xanthomonas arboricola]